MKLATFCPPNHWEPRTGCVDTRSGKIIDLNAAYTHFLSAQGKSPQAASRLADALVPPVMRDFIEMGSEALEGAKTAVGEVLRLSQGDEAPHDSQNRPLWYDLSDVTLRAPIPNPPSIGIGFFNDPGIIEEASRDGDDTQGIEMAIDYPDIAAVSWGLPGAVIGTGDSIVFPEISHQVYNSIELGLVVGKRAYRVPKENANDHIFGYVVTSDITAFDLVQDEHFIYTHVRCKDMPSFWPTGPWITTADEIEDAMDLRVAVRVNGKVIMDKSTSHYRFSPADYIHDVSRFMVLEPGTIIAMGAFTDTTTESFIEVGDAVENEIEGLGVLRNHVVAE